jgi:hypothetical protein
MRYSSKTKKDISNYDFSQFSSGPLNAETLEDFKANSTWILPQLLALLGTKLQLIRTSDGLISFSKTLSSLGSGEITFDTGIPIERLALQGMLRVLTHSHRSQFVQGRLTGEFGARYNSIVPLIPSALKQYRGVKYSEWDWADAKRAYFLDPDFNRVADLIGSFDDDLYGPRNPDRNEEFLAIRGTLDPKLYKSVSALNRTSSPDFNALPVLLKIMLTQMWVAHPSFRHPLAITDIVNPDTPAELLVPNDILDEWSNNSAWGITTPNPTRKKTKEVVDIPWDV